jgi:CRISPR-associated endonuclease/helicase Cas3
LCEKDSIDAEETYQISRQLSQKITLTTVDQVLKFPFLYKGFEKELATFAYSKLVIDEIQAYDPNIAAMLIRALEMIVEMGGKFMVMTATLPRLYLETITKRGKIPSEQWVYQSFPNDELKRHRITLDSVSITELAASLNEKAKNKKVLVICNTVDQAIKVYKELREASQRANENVPVWLLHSRFIKQHKMLLEQQVTRFAGSGWHEKNETPETGIWVTTQIVEASLDVDFDELYTEICPLDSMFQRMGRCYRVRTYNDEQPNIFIFTESPSGVPYVYDQQLVEMSLRMLVPFDGKLMLESEKMQLVENLYSRENLKGTNFLKKFDEAMHLFSFMPYFEKKSKEAQQLLRDIRTQEVIPWCFAPEIRESLEKLSLEGNKDNRRKIRQEIEKYAVSLNERSLRYHKIATVPLEVKGVDYLHWINESDAKYDFDEKTLQGCGLIFERGADIW